MVKLRLTRTGKKNSPAFRIVATHAKEKRDSKAIEILGHYLPISKEISVNAERIQHWLSVGAQPSPTVARLLAKQNLIDKKDLPKAEFAKKPGKKAAERAAKKAKTEEAPAAPVAETVAPVAEAEVEAVAETTEQPAAEAEKATN